MAGTLRSQNTYTDIIIIIVIIIIEEEGESHSERVRLVPVIVSSLLRLLYCTLKPNSNVERTFAIHIVCVFVHK